MKLSAEEAHMQQKISLIIFIVAVIFGFNLARRQLKYRRARLLVLAQLKHYKEIESGRLHDQLDEFGIHLTAPDFYELMSNLVAEGIVKAQTATEDGYFPVKNKFTYRLSETEIHHV